MTKTNKISLKIIFGVYIFVFIFWSVYRYATHFNDLVDELLVKPFIWIAPLFIVINRKFFLSSLSIKNLTIKKIIIGIIGGIFLSLLQIIPNLINGFTLPHVANTAIPILATIGTAISEELFFRGFIFQQLKNYYQSITAYIVTSLLFMIIHIPIFLFVSHFTGTSLYVACYVTFASSIIFCFLYAYSKNLWVSIIAHYVMDVLLTFF